MPDAREQIRIRPAEPADLPALVLLEQACFAHPWSEASLRYDLEEHPEARYLTACGPDGSLIGYAAYWKTLDEGMITNIAVTAAWRRQGVGRLLLDAMISQAAAEDLRALTLEVRPGNTAARKLYEGAGFTAVGVRRGYYEDNGEDAIIMQKIIG
jgi:[ribosomal protein S18]-alanine N-acetyltransferase